MGCSILGHVRNMIFDAVRWAPPRTQKLWEAQTLVRGEAAAYAIRGSPAPEEREIRHQRMHVSDLMVVKRKLLR